MEKQVEKSLKIGNVSIAGRVVLAPMAGVTNYAFRQIGKKMGASLVYGEMVSDKGLSFKNERTQKMTIVQNDEHPIAMQIFGSDYESLKFAGKYIAEETSSDIIDVNMGCPVNKVIKSGAGSALLKEPNKIYDIIKSLKEKIDKPVTIKIRAGWDHDHINCDEIARVATKAGVDAIAIHGRTRSMMYKGTSSNEYIKMVKENTDKIVIGNGDIKNINDAIKMIEETNVDMIMVGRATLGNPWLIKDLDNYFQKGTTESIYISKDEVIAVMLEHAKNMIALFGERIGMIEMRTHAGWYFKKLPNSKAYRVKATKICSYQELEQLCFDYLINN